MTDTEQSELVEAARQARGRAYAPYSNYPVGAALRTASGDVFLGCNVENASYGLTICAERVAASSAVAAGQREFAALAIATDDGATPCGACRQFLSEFAADLSVLLVGMDDDIVRQVTLDELLPDRFESR